MVALILATLLAQTPPAPAPDPCHLVTPPGPPRCPAWRRISGDSEDAMFADPASVRRDGDGFTMALRLVYPQAHPLSATAWRAQAEAGTRQGQKVTRRLPQPKPVPVARIRVRETIPQAWRRPGPERWLLIERHRDGRCKGYVSNAPRRPSGRRILHGAHQRGKIEPSSQQLKEELGLDHFDGRSWRGLPPHWTLWFLAYGFLPLLQQRKKRALVSAGSPSLAQPALSFHPLPTLSGTSRGATSPSV